MSPAAVEQRLKLGEDSRTEFKSVARSGFLLNADDAAKTIAGLANSGGGDLFVGVEDDGQVTGAGSIQQVDALMRQTAQVCRDGIAPAIVCTQTKVEVAGRVVLVVRVPGFGPDRPYLVAGRAYIRDANRSRAATNAELVRLLEGVNYHFDEQPVEGAAYKDIDGHFVDIDGDFVRGFLVDAYPHAGAGEQPERYLRALKCLTDEGFPTVAGILMFGRDPQRWLPDARITAVRVPGTEMKLDFSDRQEIAGRLTAQIDGARAFLDRHARDSLRVEGWERKPGTAAPDALKDESLPSTALSEAILNAVTHRDYRAASQVRLLVFDDRIEVINPGMLLNKLTLDSIRLGGISQRRNPAVAALLARANRRENLGFGIPEMLRQMRERGLPEPEMDLSGGHFRVVLRARRAA